MTEIAISNLERTETIFRAIQFLQEDKARLEAEIKAKDLVIADAQPKIAFFDQVADSKDTISIGELAKALAIPGLGQNNLFKLLREKRILMQDNIPYQDYIDRGYFKIIEQSYPGSSGAVHINMKTVVFQKGVDYVRKIVKE
jgi:anti-repressor protein